MAITSGSICNGLGLQTGVPLSQLLQELRGLIDVCNLHNQHWILQMQKMAAQFALNMSSTIDSNKPIELSGELMTEGSVLKDISEDSLGLQLSRLQFLKYMMAVYMADLASSLEAEPLGIPLRKTSKLQGVYTRCQQTFHEGILNCFLFRSTNQKMKRRRKSLLARARECRRILQPFVVTCPANYKNKSVLLEAEIESLVGKTSSADILLKYEESAQLAQTEGFLHENALAMEKAGYHVLQLNQSTKTATAAQLYFDRAIVAYELYGATRKVQQLKKVVSRLQEIVQLMA
jgi:hypothetical protein